MTLYRKYRPQTLAEVTGQDHIVNVLQAAVSQNRVAHAYMFAGPRGTGKTSVARILAKAVNCLAAEDRRQKTEDRNETAKTIPCNECEHCLAIDKGSFIDVLEIDAASNGGVENARQLIEQVATAPAMGGFKVYILDEVHMLSTAAFNALLKTLEEPPSKVVFILCTTELHKVPVTILSRCQRLQFNRASLEQASQQIKKVAEAEKIKIDEAAVWLLAELADGGYRDALMLLEQLNVGKEARDKQLTRQIVIEQLGLASDAVLKRINQAIASRNSQEVLEAVQEFVAQGGAVGSLLQALIAEWRVIMTQAIDVPLAERLYGKERTAQKVGSISVDRAVEVLERLMEAQRTMVAGSGLGLEVALIDLASAKSGDWRLEAGDRAVTSTSTSSDTKNIQPPTPDLQSPISSEPLPQPDEERQATGDKGQEEVVANEVHPVQVVDPVPANAPAELLEAWQKILVELNGESRSLAAILRDCTPLSYDGTILLLQFWYEFHRKQLELDKNRKLLEKVASEILGKQVKVRGQLGDIAKRPRRRPMSEEDIHNVEPVNEDAEELLDAASKIFGVSPE